MLAAVILGALVNALGAATRFAAPIHEIATEVAAPAVALGAEKRPPFGWPAFPIEYNQATIVRWRIPDPTDPAKPPSHLRLTAAIDERRECHVEVTLARSGRPVGTLDLRYPQAMQMFELALSAENAIVAQREGLAFRLRAEGPTLWFFSPAPGDVALLPEFQPHLLHPSGGIDVKEQYYRRMASLAPCHFRWTRAACRAGDSTWSLMLVAEPGRVSIFREPIEERLRQTRGVDLRLLE